MSDSFEAKNLQELDKLRRENAELRRALLKWRAYFQADTPREAIEHEEAAEQFTEAWYAMEEALGNLKQKKLNR